jgi:predicted metallopeptidase
MMRHAYCCMGLYRSPQQNGEAPMHRFQQLSVGDRVRVLRPLAHVPKGSNGTIQRAFATVDLYDVLFDEGRVLYVIHRRDLAVEEQRAREVGG